MKRGFNLSNLNKAGVLVLDWMRSNQLVRGSLVVFVGAAVANFGNYLYHLLMGRMLGPAGYGVLSSLISITYFLGVPIGTLNLMVVRQTASLKSKRKELAGFYQWILTKALRFVLPVAFVFLIFSPFVASWLRISSWILVAIVLLSGLLGVLVSINLGVFRGLLKFAELTGLNIAAAALKLFLAVFLVYLGLGVLGAVFPFLLTSFFILVLSFWGVRRFLKKKRGESFGNTLGVVNCLLSIFLFNLAHTSLYSSDIILAKRFLLPEQAGFYAALSTLGKIIFFTTSPIVSVMFPLVSERYASGGNYKKIFFLSFLLVFLVTISVGGVYLVFPQIVVYLLFGPRYFPIVPYLKFFVPIFFFFTLSFLLLNFFLSVGKAKAVGIYLLAAVSHVLLIILFHQSLFELILVSLAVMSFLFVSLMLYYFLDERKD